MVNNRTSPIPLVALSIASISHFSTHFCQTISHTECHHVENTFETRNNIASDETNRSWINNQRERDIKKYYDKFFIKNEKTNKRKTEKKKLINTDFSYFNVLLYKGLTFLYNFHPIVFIKSDLPGLCCCLKLNISKTTTSTLFIFFFI